MQLPETLTVWNEASKSGFGGINWAAPVVLNSRNAYRQEQVRNVEGALVMSKAVAYAVGDALRMRSAVAFGTYTSLTPPTSAERVISIAETPTGAPGLKKIWL